MPEHHRKYIKHHILVETQYATCFRYYLRYIQGCDKETNPAYTGNNVFH